MTAKRDFTRQWRKFFWIAGLFVALVVLLYMRFVFSRQPGGVVRGPVPVRAVAVVSTAHFAKPLLEASASTSFSCCTAPKTSASTLSVNGDGPMDFYALTVAMTNAAS